MPNSPDPDPDRWLTGIRVEQAVARRARQGEWRRRTAEERSFGTLLQSLRERSVVVEVLVRNAESVLRGKVFDLDAGVLILIDEGRSGRGAELHLLRRETIMMIRPPLDTGGSFDPGATVDPDDPGAFGASNTSSTSGASALAAGSSDRCSAESQWFLAIHRHLRIGDDVIACDATHPLRGEVTGIGQDLLTLLDRSGRTLYLPLAAVPALSISPSTPRN